MAPVGFPELLRQDIHVTIVQNEASEVSDVMGEYGFMRGCVYFVTLDALRGYSCYGPIRGL